MEKKMIRGHLLILDFRGQLVACSCGDKKVQVQYLYKY